MAHGFDLLCIHMYIYIYIYVLLLVWLFVMLAWDIYFNGPQNWVVEGYIRTLICIYTCAFYERDKSKILFNNKAKARNVKCSTVTQELSVMWEFGCLLLCIEIMRLITGILLLAFISGIH